LDSAEKAYFSSPQGVNSFEPATFHVKQNETDHLLSETFPEGEVYSVGGRVRDELLADLGRAKTPTADADYLVTGVPLSEIIARLSRHGRTELVGASFGVVKFTRAGLTVDVALPRRERSIGPQHRDFDIESAPDIPVEDDLGRRDFRINMMARRLSDKALIDPFGGLEDLKNRRLDIAAPAAFDEDPLRILRGAQFAARFGLQTTTGTLQAMKAAAHLVPTIAPERVADELTKLLTRAPAPSVGFELLRETGALNYIMPELLEGWGVEQNEFHRYTVYYHSLRSVDEAPRDLTVSLAALLHDIGKPRTKSGPHFYRHELVGERMAQDLLGRLRFSGDTISRVSHLIRHHMFASDDALTDAAVRRFISRVGLDAIQPLFSLRKADVLASGLPERNPDSLDRFAGRVQAELAGPAALGLTQLAIDGAEVIKIMRDLQVVGSDFRGDARVGEALRACLEAVLDDPTINNRDELSRIVRARFESEAHRE